MTSQIAMNAEVAAELRRELELECLCNSHGFCPVHGTLIPFVTDPTILSMLAESSRSSSGHRVIRKTLES